MMYLKVFPLLLMFGIFASVSALKCNEGFNASFSGVPLYHWVENTCTANSECFGQELTVKVNKLDIVMRYGGCVSSAYSSYLTCENLFGKDSTLDPAVLVDLIPDLDQRFQQMVQSIAADTVDQIPLLLSNGRGPEEFVEGIIKFMENLGLNMDKVKQIEPELAAVFKVTLSPDLGADKQSALESLLTALSNLDTDNPAISKSIYKFLKTLIVDDRQVENLKGTPYAVLIDKLPGLVRSTLPADAARWHDALFEILGEIQINNPRQTVTDVLNTINATANFPAEVTLYLNPIFKALPAFVQHLVEGYSWPTLIYDALRFYSVNTTASTNLLNAVKSVLRAQGVPIQLSPPFLDLLPGIFYKLFPTKDKEISKFYQKIADELNSADFTDLSKAAESTRMSQFLLDTIAKTTPAPLPAQVKGLILKLSKMFYNLLSDYKAKLDIFFDTLIDGFKGFPDFDTGMIITQLVANLGGTVPPEVKPLLDNIQTLISNYIAPADVNGTLLAVRQIIAAYKTAYPDSEFPGLVERYIEYFAKYPSRYEVLATGRGRGDKMQSSYYYSVFDDDEGNNLEIDTYFAIFDAMNYSHSDFYANALESFPTFRVYVNLIGALDRDDVKELFKNFYTWLRTVETGSSAQAFADAMKPTIKKITAKLGSVTKELRSLFQPNSCKYTSCDADECNAHERIDEAKPVVKKASKSKSQLTTTSTTPTSGSPRIGFSLVILACSAQASTVLLI